MLARRFSDEIRRYYTSVAVAARDLAVARSTHLEIAALLAKVVAREPRESLKAIYTGPQTAELIPRIVEHLTEALLDDEAYTRFLSCRDEVTALADFATLFDDLPSPAPFRSFEYANFAPRINASISALIDPSLVEVPDLPSASEIAEHIDHLELLPTTFEHVPRPSRPRRLASSFVDDEAMEVASGDESPVDMHEEVSMAIDGDSCESTPSPVSKRPRRASPRLIPFIDLSKTLRKKSKKKARQPGF